MLKDNSVGSDVIKEAEVVLLYLNTFFSFYYISVVFTYRLGLGRWYNLQLSVVMVMSIFMTIVSPSQM